MKKLLFLLPLLTIGTVTLTGCPKDKRARLTFGTLVDKEAEKIAYTSLQIKVGNGENLLVAIHQDLVPGPECSCWVTFKGILDQYVDEYNTKIYWVNASEISDDDNEYKIPVFSNETNPALLLFKDGKKVNQYVYANDTKPIFEKLSGLRKAISKIAQDPQYYYVDREYLDNALFTVKEDVIIHYVWSFCPDCNDCLPNVLLPYTHKNSLSHNMWIINLAVTGILLNDAGQFEGTGLQTYVDFLREHKMSSFEGNEELGYDRGFVPTTQVWKDGELKDASVYFNDLVEKVEGKYTVTRSFYSEERMANLGYSAKVIQGKVLNADEVDVEVDADSGVESYKWKMDSARELHQANLESFLNKYVK